MNAFLVIIKRFYVDYQTKSIIFIVLYRLIKVYNLISNPCQIPRSLKK